MPTGLYARWDLDSERGKFMPRQKKTRGFENMVMSYSQQTRPEGKTESFDTTGRQNKLTVPVLRGFVRIATLCLKQWLAFITFVFVEMYVHFPLTKIFNVEVTKVNSMDWDEVTNKRKVSLSLKCGSVSGEDCIRQPLMLSYISKKTSFTDDHLQNVNS